MESLIGQCQGKVLEMKRRTSPTPSWEPSSVSCVEHRGRPVIIRVFSRVSWYEVELCFHVETKWKEKVLSTAPTTDRPEGTITISRSWIRNRPPWGYKSFPERQKSSDWFWSIKNQQIRCRDLISMFDPRDLPLSPGCRKWCHCYSKSNNHPKVWLLSGFTHAPIIIKTLFLILQSVKHQWTPAVVTAAWKQLQIWRKIRYLAAFKGLSPAECTSQMSHLCPKNNIL